MNLSALNQKPKERDPKEWLSLMLETKDIVNYKYDGTNPPYQYYKYDISTRNKTISDKVFSKYITQIKAKFSEVKENDIYSLLLLNGLGISKFVLIHHFLTGEWVNEVALFAHEVVETCLMKGNGLYDYKKKTFDGGHSVWTKNDLLNIITTKSTKNKETPSVDFAHKVIAYIAKMNRVYMSPTGLVYYADYYNAETHFLSETAIKRTEVITLPENIADTATDEQKAVATSIITTPAFLSVMQAPAGHGKTFTAIQIARNYNNFSVLAPTGKAALNFSNEVNGYDRDNGTTINNKMMACTTVHSMYYSTKYASGAEREIETIELLIVDEFSMVSSEILKMINYLVEAKEVKKLLILGDYYQCPPVGCGFVMRDIVHSHPAQVYSLSKNMRAHGIESLISLFDTYRDFMDKKDSSSCLSLIKRSQFAHLLPIVPLQEHHYKQFLVGETVIVSYKNDVVDYYNHIVIQKLFSEYQEHINDIEYALDGTIQDGNKRRKRNYLDKDYKGFYPIGMRLFVTENCIINGIRYANGTIITIDDNKGKQFYSYNEDQHIIHFVDDYKQENFCKVADIYSITKPAFCGTVHKLQGSGYRNVIFVASGNIPIDVCYTALTRAKKNLYIAYTPDFSISLPCDRKTLFTHGEEL